MKLLPIRLHPDQDLLLELERYATQKNIDAACVVTCVGSLTTAVLRFANQNEPTTVTGHFEIVSLTGMFSTHGSHFHIAISDKNGKTLGAHLLPGSRIYTTAEIVIGVLPHHQFLRTFDPQTGYPELDIQPAQTKKGE
ncbi:MAG: DNA-binding protein [Desulfovibrionales bacterium]|nr:DNA-binding protein [Desulfovibrionales bacterium]